MPAEHLIKDDDDFEEDTLFDQAGLLTNKIKKSPDIHNVHSTMRITPMKTFALCLAFFGLGISLSILEPTLLDLQYLSQADFQQIFYTISGRAVGSIIGLILGMFLFDRYNRQFLLFLSMLAMTVFLGVMPWCSNLVAYVLIMVILGALMQLLYAGGNVLCLDLWGRQSGPFLQAIHFSLSVGLFIAPLLSTTITAGKAGLTMSGMPDRVTLNNSLLLSLPASALYSVHFRLPALQQSRHRRSILPSEQNETYLTSTVSKLEPNNNNFTTTIIVPLNITSILENRTIADQRLELNSSGSNLPLNVSEVNGTSADAFNNANSTISSQLITSTTNTTGTTARKPKPKPEAANGKFLKDNDPWARKEKPLVAKPVAKLSSSSSVMTTSDRTVTTVSTNSTTLPINNANRTEAGLFNVSTVAPVENYTDVQTNVSDNVTTGQNNEKLIGISTPNKDDSGQSTNSSVDNANNNETAHDVDYANETMDNVASSGVKSATPEQQQTDTVTDENADETLLSVSTSASSLFNKMTNTNVTLSDTAQSSVDSENSEAVIANNANNGNSSSEMNKQVPSSTSKLDNLSNSMISSTSTAADVGLVSEETNLANQATETEQQQPFASMAEHPTSTSIYATHLDNIKPWETNNEPEDAKSVTKSPLTPDTTVTSSSEDYSSPVLKVVQGDKTTGVSNCSMSKNSNGSSQDKIEHHKKPNTFNNQTEENQMLLSELLSQITAMGMTKVHIVYAVMAVIVFLTSLVFLSFLCQNPRELRSKQEEGVKPGIPEIKFTSIMVGLTFVLMIFYTMAHLIFSQLYLSLVLQESVHLLHSRGSLLISVFWGIYTFSRATSICCTNGFKPVTMLLLDFACCIVSSVTLSTVGSRVESVLWCSVAVMSIGLSSIFPYCLLWLEDYIHISNRNMCIILLGGEAVDLILSLTFGHSISLSSTTVMYLVLVSCIFALLIFGIMWRLATWRGDKFGFSKTDTQYHLASQTDEEEDSIEFPSGNSSLYLLNGGTHFPLSSWDRKNGNSYIPLQHNNTVKWK